MKKLFTIVASAILVGASTFAAISWNGSGIENMAKGATVTVSSNPADAAFITDDNNGTSWQAAANTHDYTRDWVLIELSEEKTFTDLEIVWEASHCKSYSVYVSKTPITVEEKSETVTEGEGENAKDVTNNYNFVNVDDLIPAANGDDNTEAGYTELITFDEPQTGKYILIYADEYNNFGDLYGMRIFDVRVANIENRDEITNLQLTQEGNGIAGTDEAVKVTIAPLSKVGEVMDMADISDINLTCDNQAVTITATETAGEYNVTADKHGTYTLTATAKAGDNTVEGTIEVNFAYNWADATNIINQDMVIVGRINTEFKGGDGDDKLDPKYPNEHPELLATDGDEETYYEYNGEWGGGNGWLLIDLGAEYMVDAIGVSYGDLSGGKCVIGYATDITKT